MTDRYYSSVATPTTLSSGINNSTTTIVVGSVTGFPTLYPYTLALDFDTALTELVDVTNAAGTTLTVVRAVDGTSATSHSAGAAVRHVASARDYADSRAHENSDSEHGVSGFIVGTGNSQTLTNKTLTSPVINGATITGGTITGATLTTPAITDFTNAQHNHSNAAGGGGLREIVVDNNAIGDVPVRVNAITGTTADLLKLQINSADVVTVGADGDIDSPGDLNMGGSGVIGTGLNVTTGNLAVQSGSLSVSGGATLGSNLGVTGNGTFTGDLSADNFMPGSTTFATVWSANLGTPSIGNGTMEMTYALQGNICTVWFRWTSGPTTTFGTSNNVWQWTLPFNWLSVNRFGGIARSTGTIFRLGYIEALGPNQFIITGDETGFAWGNRNGVPFPTPLGAGLTIHATFSYEIA